MRYRGVSERRQPAQLSLASMRQRLLGEEPQDMAASLNSLALLYANQGHYEIAAPLLE